jgi:indolepyruvate ferredoxin oxidoreductase
VTAEATVLSDRFTADSGEYFFTGVQALVRMLLDSRRRDRAAGLRTAAFVSGYPGSPLGGLDRELDRQRALLDGLDMVHRRGVNEDLAATAVMGSQFASTFPQARVDGVLGIWYGKAPGLDRSVDALRHAVYGGASAVGGALLLVGDDPASSSSTLPSSSERLLAELGVPVLFPGNIQQVLDYGAHAIELSRRSGLWAAMKMVTPVADGTGTGHVGWERLAFTPSARTPADRVDSRQLVPPLSSEMEGRLLSWLDAARDYGVANRLNAPVTDPADAWLSIIAGGHTYQAVVEALGVLGFSLADLGRHGVRLVHLGLIHPLDPASIRAWAHGVEQVFVVEEKRPFVEVAVREALYGTPGAPAIVGKRSKSGQLLVPGHGVLDGRSLVEPLREVLLERISAELMRPPAPTRRPGLVLLPAESRTAFFCSGCPHPVGLRVPEGTTVGAGIGCHSMARSLPTERVGEIATVTHMGGEGAQWVGIEPFIQPTPFVQNLGDGTLMHSGYLAIRFAVASGAHLTYKVLYNSAVAMTGGQDPVGMLSVPDLCRALLAEGVTAVAVTTSDRRRYRRRDLPHSVRAYRRDDIIEAQRRLVALPGVTVLIHDQECAAELRRHRKAGRAPVPDARLVINERVCEGCGDCGAKSACLSLQPVVTEFGRKTAINQESCNIDRACLAGDCPSFAEVRPARRGKGRAPRVVPQPPDIPREPVRTSASPVVTIRMPGIGGTGVVTAAQLLGVAAGLDGKHAAGSDQTGISQKAGPVVSEVRISDDAATGPLSSSEVDVLLVLDLLVALAPGNLSGVDPKRTAVVGSSSRTPTGAMVTDIGFAYPDIDAMVAEIDHCCRRGHAFWVDANAATQVLLGTPVAANIFMLGVAFQRGVLPLTPGAIEQAIVANGAMVELNLAAFRWGRYAVAEADDFAASLAGARPSPRPLPAATGAAVVEAAFSADVDRLVRLRASDLIDFQGKSLAHAYVSAVQASWSAEREAAPGSDIYTRTVAHHLHRVMAYKDEYEVARLLAAPDAAAGAEAVGGPGARVSWMLHPPVLRAIGRSDKVRFGAWARPVMWGLRHGRLLRGTALDPFGHTAVRAAERRLVADYLELCAHLNAEVAQIGPADAARIAALVDVVRGYEDVKLRNLERYHAQLREQLGERELLRT